MGGGGVGMLVKGGRIYMEVGGKKVGEGEYLVVVDLEKEKEEGVVMGGYIYMEEGEYKMGKGD